MKATARAATTKSAPASPAAWAPPRLVIADGTLEALKWLALVLMVLDHTNKFLLEGKVPVIFDAARIAMPLFGFVLAYNLARPCTTSATYLRTMKRLLIFGLLASPMFVAMVGWWPLNIMFMLLLVVAVVYLFDRGGPWQRVLAISLFVVAGALVEFWWPAVLACVMAWAYFRRPTVNRLIGWVGAVAALGLINGNLWALAVFPVVLGAGYLQLTVPRWRYLFYALYPLHLAALWLVLQLR